MIHTVRGLSIVNEAEVDVFLEFSRFFYDPTMLAIWSLVLLPFLFKFSLNIWKFLVEVLLKPGLENFKHYFAGMWNECNCAVVWTFFGTAFLWDWNETWPFPVLWPLLSFSYLLAYWLQHFNSIIFYDVLPWWLSWQRICLQCRRPGFDPWVGKIPWRRARLPPPVFWPGEFPGWYRCKESDTTEWPSLLLGFEIAQLEFHHLHKLCS